MITLRTERMSDFFTKYHLDNGVIVHHLTGPDDGDAHDHPFWIDIEVLFGGYAERVYYRDGSGFEIVQRRHGDKFRIDAAHIHRISHLNDAYCLTACRYGPWEKQPGFYRFDDGRVLYRQWNEREFREI